MRDRFRLLAAAMLLASVLHAGWLLGHPETPPTGAAQAPGSALPSLDPVVALVADGREADAIILLATMVRTAPGLADKGGPLASSPELRDLVLNRWKGVVSAAGEGGETLTQAIRSLQRRLAGGCA